MSDLEGLVTEVTTSVDLVGVSYHDEYVEVRFHLLFASRTYIELPIRIPYTAFPDHGTPPTADRPHINEVVLKASQWLCDIAQTLNTQAQRIPAELNADNWPFPMT